MDKHGLRQRCGTAPRLVNIFLDGVAAELEKSSRGRRVKSEDAKKRFLHRQIFPDDTALVVESAKKLQ